MTTQNNTADAVAAYGWPGDPIEPGNLPIGAVPAGLPGAAASQAAGVESSWAPVLSPTADQVAFLSDRSGAPRVWTQPVTGGDAHLVDTGDEPVAEVSWSPDGEWLACLIAPGGGTRTEAWLVRPDGRDLHQVGGSATGAAVLGDWSAHTGRLSVVESDATGSIAYLVDPATGWREELATADLLAVLDVSPDERFVLLRRGPRNERWLELLDRTDGSRVELLRGDGSTDVAHFAAGGDLAYVRTDTGRDLPALVAVPLDGTARTIVAERADAELETFVLSHDRRTAVLLWNLFGGRSEATLLDLVTGTQAAISAPPGDVYSHPVLSADGRRLTLTAEGPSQPKGIWLVDTERAIATPVTYPPPQSAPDVPVIPELHRYTGHDGTVLTGWLYRASGAEAGPLVLHLHGGPEAQDRPVHNPLYTDLVARGITVFAPNVRGSSGFGRRFVNADNGPLRYDAIADVESTVKYLVGSGIAVSGRIGCMGRSYGGYLTLAALVWFPELFAVGVDMCGMGDLATFYERTEPWIATAAYSKYGHPVTDAALLADISPLHRFDRLAAPLLVVHGENDTNVPVEEALQVVAELARRDLPGRLLLFPDEGHELLQQVNRAKYGRVVGEWLAEHLGVPSGE